MTPLIWVFVRRQGCRVMNDNIAGAELLVDTVDLQFRYQT